MRDHHQKEPGVELKARPLFHVALGSSLLLQQGTWRGPARLPAQLAALPVPAKTREHHELQTCHYIYLVFLTSFRRIGNHFNFPHSVCPLRIDQTKPYNEAAEMADEVPLALKQADINLYKTATRGAQLQTIKPIIAYWCMFSLEGSRTSAC